MKKYILLGLACIVVGSLFGVVGSLLGGCRRTVNTHYVLPDGFRGRFKIMQNQSDGIELPVKDGTYIYEIPKNGTLKLNGPNPAINRGQFPKASYENGEEIPIPSDGSLPSNQVGFTILVTNGEGTTWFFVGTREEFEREPPFP